MKKKDLPIYDITIDNIDEAGVKFLSLVDDPAVEIKGLYFKTEKIDDVELAKRVPLPPIHPNCMCEIVNAEWIKNIDCCDLCTESKQNFDQSSYKNALIRRANRFSAVKDKQIIVGPAIIADKKIYRKDESGEYYVRFTAENIKKIVNKFFSSGTNRRINVDHSNRIVDAYIQQNWIVEDQVYDKSRYYGFEDITIGSWFVEVKIDDTEFWNNEVKELGKFGFSVEGLLGLKPMEFIKEQSMDEYIDSLTFEELQEIIKSVR